MIDKELAEKLNTINITELERKDLGPFNFSELGDLLKEYFNFFVFLVDVTNPILPDQTYIRIENKLRNFIDYTNRIKNFDPNVPNPSDARDRLKQEIINHWQSAFNELSSIYTYIAIKKSHIESIKHGMEETKAGLDKMLSNVENRNKKAKVFLDKIKTDSENTSIQVQKILEDARKFSADQVVTKYGKIFENQAEKEHKLKIVFWWKMVLGSIVIEIILAFGMIWLYLEFFAGLDMATSISIAFVKLFILSASALVVVQCVKNLNAQNHLYTLNKYRSNALASFEAFINSTKDEQVKDALLIQIAKAIYDPSISGYLSKEDSSQHFNHVEIIKQMIDGK
ncbi:MAG: hypothetical protein KAS07_00360 [Candidatus Pacebacteria bacterium]|nr:hypothetical protein [Candidatus Paceibacterota bacterium]